MKKVSGRLAELCFQTTKHFIWNDHGFLFINEIKDTPAYWERFQGEVLAIVKQLGCPTFFLTLSCPNLRWNKLVAIISMLNSLGLNHKYVEDLNYLERCNFLNSNTVFLTRHFQHRIEILF